MQRVTRLAAAWAVFATSTVAFAQPAATNLGDFGASASTTQTANVTITTGVPVQWYRIRLPRIFNPHRFLDISTSGSNSLSDTEIALFSSDGILQAFDDDDGANNYSALSFGITDPNAPTRVPPLVNGTQAAGVANNGRDGALTGNPLTGTAAEYYIAVTQYDVNFSNGFIVARQPTPALTGLTTLLTVRMHTPGGQAAPTVDGADRVTSVFFGAVFGFATASANTTGINLDLSAANGPSAGGLVYSSANNNWSSFNLSLFPSPPAGMYPILYRASNAIGDVTTDPATLTVFPSGRTCFDSYELPISNTPGTSVYTYTTTLGDVDGPWTNACYTSVPTGNDVWFEYFSSQSGTLTLSTCNADTGATGTQPDTLLGVLTVCLASAFTVCGDDVGGCGLGTRLTNIPVVANEFYFIAVRSWSGDIVNGKLAVTITTGGGCDSIDFNNDGVSPDTQDITDFLSVYGGGPCSTGMCGDIDFNNDDVSPDTEDINAFLRVYGGGNCS